MTPEAKVKAIKRMATLGWELDLYSTPFSRRYSHHRCIGPLRFTKPNKEKARREACTRSAGY